MAREDNLKPQWKKGESGNPNGRPKGSRNRSTIARKWLNVKTKAINPLSQEEEDMNQEDMITLALIKKARQGDVAASKAILDSAYGQPKEQLDISADAPSIDFRSLFNFKNDTDKTKD